MNSITRVVLGSVFIFFCSPTLLISASSLSVAYERADRPQTAGEKHSGKLLVRDPFTDLTRQRSVPVLRIRGRTPAKIPPGEDYLPKFTLLPDVSVTCLSTSFVLRVKKCFYGFSAVEEELTLGETCKSNGVLEPQNDLLFTYALADCQGEQQDLPDYVVYKYVLHFVPLQTRETHLYHRVNVGVECRYERDELRPTWRKPLRKMIRSRSTDFQIQLMDDSWSSPIRTAEFLLGQMVNVQVSTRHLYPGVKLFINSCYAAAVNIMNQANKYSIIDNYGCLLESRINPSASRFRISRADNVVQFSFHAFQFTDSPNAQISLHCELSVSGGSPSSMQKLCFYSRSDRRWISVFGQDSVCRCCDSVCNQTKSKRIIYEGFVSSDQVLFSDPVTSPLSTLNSTHLRHTNDDLLWFEAKSAKEPQRAYNHKDFVASVISISSEDDEKRQEKSHTSTVELMEEESKKMEQIHGDVEILMAVGKSFVGSERPDLDITEEFPIGSLGWSGERKKQDMVKRLRYWSDKNTTGDILQEDKDFPNTSVILPGTGESALGDTQHLEVFLQTLMKGSVNEKYPVGSDELEEQGLVRKLDLTQDSDDYSDRV